MLFKLSNSFAVIFNFLRVAFRLLLYSFNAWSLLVGLRTIIVVVREGSAGRGITSAPMIIYSLSSTGSIFTCLELLAGVKKIIPSVLACKRALSNFKLKFGALFVLSLS